MSHAFSVELAQIYGIECAILINHFQFWIEQNQRMGRNFHDGRTWMYQTQKEIASIYPYWSEDIVHKLIKKLIEAKVLIKGNYNKTSFDKTGWYAFENEKMFTKPSNVGINPVDHWNQSRQPPETIPDTYPDTYPKKQQQQPASDVVSFSIEEVLAPKKEKDPTNEFNKIVPQPENPSMGSPRENPVPIYNNTNSSNLREQQQQTPAAASFYKELKDIDIPAVDKIEITKTYPIESVRHGLLWLQKNEKPLTRGIAAALKWACKVQPEIPEPKKPCNLPVNPEGYNKCYYREVYKVAHKNGIRLDQIGIQDGNEYLKTEHDKIYFKDNSFLEQIANYLRKKSIDCRNIYDMISTCQKDLVKQLC
jgi:hypothetical protein